MDSSYEASGKLDITSLKLIASASMLIDHIGMVLFPGVTWLRVVGRLAMPIYCFSIAEGLHHTRDRGMYMLRIFLFALLSEYPIDMATRGSFGYRSQNVMFTFLFAIAGICACDAIRGMLQSFAGDLAGCLAAALFAAGATAFRTDYGRFGVTMVYILYFLRPYIREKVILSSLYVAAERWGTIAVYCIPSYILISHYNGKRGKGLKYFFYFFYPAHLMILYLIKICLRTH